MRSRLGESGFEEAWEQGRAMSFEQAVEYALDTDEALPRHVHKLIVARGRTTQTNNGEH